MVREIGLASWLVGFEANLWGGLVKPIPHQLAMIRVSREIQRTCRFCPPRATASDLLHLPFIACFCLLSLMLSPNEHSPTQSSFHYFVGKNTSVLLPIGRVPVSWCFDATQRAGGCFGIVGVSTAAFSASAFAHLFFFVTNG